MFHPSWYHKRSASFRSTPLLALFALLALVAGLSAHPQDQASKQQIPDLKSAKPGEAKPFSVTTSTTGPSGTLLAAQSSPAAFMSPGSQSRVATPQAGTADYYLIRAEFDSEAPRRRLALPGFTVLTGIDRFVELFVSPKIDDATWNTFSHAQGLRWIQFA